MNQIIEKIKNPDKFNFYFLQEVDTDGVKSVRKEKARYFVTKDDRIARYARNKKRFGYPVEDVSKIVIEDKKTTKTPERKWKDSWMKVVQRLEHSGLYTDLLENIKLALEIGYEKIQLAYEIYWKTDKSLSYEDNQKARDVEIKNLDERLLMDGHPNTEILWYIKYDAKVKKMNFGRWSNEDALKTIKDALKNKKETSVSGRANYDVSFSYNPKLNKAWYSEEYRGCGNGHYYLALDATHALFYEDD